MEFLNSHGEERLKSPQWNDLDILVRKTLTCIPVPWRLSTEVTILEGLWLCICTRYYSKRSHDTMLWMKYSNKPSQVLIDSNEPSSHKREPVIFVTNTKCSCCNVLWYYESHLQFSFKLLFLYKLPIYTSSLKGG